jgi:hypothetical protein
MASPTAQAWNKPGHMTSAAIAYNDLKELNPAVLDKVVQVLRQHPQSDLLWARELSQADDRDMYLFMLAARWPDDVRKKYPEYDRPEWHYVNIPYRPGEVVVTIPEGDSIISAFPDNRSTAQSASADEKAPAVALCWMFHLTGDVHQPLHTTKLVTEQFPEPEGDRGGTRFYIRVTPSNKTISLHQLWDGLILGSDKFQTVRNKATELRNRPGFKREDFAEQLAVKPFNDWAAETYTIAVDQAYRKGTLQGSTNKDDGVVLPSDYNDRVKEVAERQIVLSGYRISDAMVEVFGR